MDHLRTLVVGNDGRKDSPVDQLHVLFQLLSHKEHLKQCQDLEKGFFL